MITILGFGRKIAPERAPGEIYRALHEEPQASRAAGVFALALAAATLYVRSLMGEAAAKPIPPEAPQDADQPGSSPTPAEGDEEAPDQAPRVGSSSPPPEEAPLETLAPDGPAFDFGKLDPAPTTPGSWEAAMRRSALNDNGSVLPTQSEASRLGAEQPSRAGAGGGGSGGEGGASSGSVSGGSGDASAGPPGQPTSRNRAPQVNSPVRLADIGGCQTVLITAAALLAGATDADGDTLTVRALAASGGRIDPVEGGWLFTPEAGSFGPVTLSYDISDGVARTPQLARFEVLEFIEFVGDAGENILVGSVCADRIDARSGDDLVDARGGSDIVLGDLGADHIVAGAGNDTVDGGSGDDLIFGGDGDDVLSGGNGADRIYGEAGADILQGGAGNDVLDGGGGDDQLDGGSGDDELLGGSGDDVLAGGEGNDSLSGASGLDMLEGGGGADTLDGGDGDDILLAGEGQDIVVGAAGADRLFGGDGADNLDGGSGDDVIDGGAGDDTLAGGDGRDVLIGAAGADSIDGGKGDDVVILRLDGDHDTADGGDGLDTLDFSGATVAVTVDLAHGRSSSGSGSGNDDVVLSFEVVVGGSGDDLFIAGELSVTLEGGSGDDEFRFDGLRDAGARPLIHQIRDLEAGDRIVIDQYQFREFLEQLDDQAGLARSEENEDRKFVLAYGEQDDANRPFRFRQETSGPSEKTYLDVFADNGVDHTFTVEMNGVHKLYYV
ncbi:hypothetical protein GCM10007036_22420 [Alsobacter metallidurans]|uniref:Cadherin-like domain-containing protein n=1 Tax=Alsobacter metallidurans TaxID=340221 RepID=A0A917MJS1_9HYPH|nr:cadherin-like domain-containing protein [Alsobacter metallidurans]GGH19481.1 hypothetical protein GCM10007036_22420 [Alsobacter metallidurans]